MELPAAKNAAELNSSILKAVGEGLESFAIPVAGGSAWFSDPLLGKAFDELNDRADGACPWYQRSSYTTFRKGEETRVVFTVEYKLPPSRVKEEVAASLAAAKSIAERAKAKATDAERHLLIHDELAQGAVYDQSLFEKGVALAESYTPYGALVAGLSVCDGFSKAYLLVAQLAGLECRFIKGQANGGPHSWNLVKVAGKWYHVDVTFDLCDQPYGWSRGHFMVDDAIVARAHSWNKALYPACVDATADYYTARGQTLPDLAAVGPYLKKIAAKGPGRYEFRVRKINPETFNDDTLTVFKRGIGNLSWSFNTDSGSGLVILILEK
jgi:hypothetical protein